LHLLTIECLFLSGGGAVDPWTYGRHDIFGKKDTKYTFTYGVFIRFWPYVQPDQQF